MGLTEEVNMPYTYLERLSACSVFCSRDRSATDTGFHHQEQSRIRSQTVFRLIFGSASTRHPSPQAHQSHPCVAKGSSDRSSARPPCPQVPQGHPRVAKGDFWTVFGTATLPTGTSEPSSRGEGGPLSALRHGDLAYRYLRGIPSWRRGYSFRPSGRRPCPQMLQGHPCGATVSWCIG